MRTGYGYPTDCTKNDRLLTAMASPKFKQISWRVNTFLPLLMVGLSWIQVAIHQHQLRQSTILSYQQQQQKNLKHLAQIVEMRWRQAIAIGQPQGPTAQQLRQEFQQLSSTDHLGAPIWLQETPHPKLLAHQATPSQSGAQFSSHSSWQNLWSGPTDPAETIQTWAPVRILADTPSAQTWVIGTTTPIKAILQAGAIDQRMQSERVSLILLSLGMFWLQWLLLRQQQRQQQYATEVSRLCDTDTLTGLANRSKLQQYGEQSIRQLNDRGALTLITLNLDRFKPINEQLGTEAGDLLLIQVADRLQRHIRKADILARLGSDEFAMLLSDSDAAEAQRFADRLLQALQKPFFIRNQNIYISGSMGIATLNDRPSLDTHSTEPPPPVHSFGQLMTQADIAMYQAKHKQNGSYALFDASMGVASCDRISLETDLHQAIANGELQVYYQPIVHLETQQISGYEALIRWNHPHRGILNPTLFLPIAAAIGQSTVIEHWVLRQACRQMAQWHRHRGPNWQQQPLPSISINISAQHIAQVSLVVQLKQILAETGWPAHRVTLEITEEAMIQDTEIVIEILMQIRQLGIRISLDDFGTGYSSLSYLQHFQFDILKIDRSFIKTIRDREQDSEIVKSIISLAHHLGINTIAEGIETHAQLDRLKALDCQYGQGFFFAKPMQQISDCTELNSRHAC
jgi:diguanylate cyclase (GGDEF)-like protein